MPPYKVLEGVHRCVAARKAGLKEIPARIDTGGRPGPATLVPLDQVFTTKREIGRWDRRRDFLVLVQLYADEATRDAIPPVELKQVSDRVANRLTRVADVVVTPV